MCNFIVLLYIIIFCIINFNNFISHCISLVFSLTRPKIVNSGLKKKLSFHTRNNDFVVQVRLARKYDVSDMNWTHHKFFRIVGQEQGWRPLN